MSPKSLKSGFFFVVWKIDWEVKKPAVPANACKSAVIDQTGTYSYQDVLNRARGVALELPKSVEPGDRLCFMVEVGMDTRF